MRSSIVTFPSHSLCKSEIYLLKTFMVARKLFYEDCQLHSMGQMTLHLQKDTGEEYKNEMRFLQELDAD